MDCKHCQKPLATGIFKQNRTFKSCPNCSKNNGQYHVYYPYSAAFGTTPKRSTGVNPDGPQSHCIDCRGGQSPHSFPPILCNNV